MAHSTDAGKLSKKIHSKKSSKSYSSTSTIWKYICLPGVDYYGDLDWYKTSKGKCKIVIDYKKGTCYALCTGRVCNASCYPQTYCNYGVIGPDVCPNCCWYKDTYTVDKRGNCRACAWGYYSCDCGNDDPYDNGPA